MARTPHPSAAREAGAAPGPVCVDAPPGRPHPAAAHSRRCVEHQQAWRRFNERQRGRRRRGLPPEDYEPAAGLGPGTDVLSETTAKLLSGLVYAALAGSSALLAYRAGDEQDPRALMFEAQRCTHRLCAAVDELIAEAGPPAAVLGRAK